MSTYKRLPRGKRKNSPDEILDWTLRCIHFLRENIKIIGMALGTIALTTVIVFIVIQIQNYRENKAVIVFSKVQNIENLQDRIKSLQELVDDYGSTKIGRFAMLTLADDLFTQGDFDKSKDVFSNLAEKTKRTPILHVASLHGEGRAEYANGKYQEAAESFLEASNYPKNINKALSLLEVGRCYEKLGDYEKAREYYKQSIELAEGSKIKDHAEESLLWLVTNGDAENK